MLLGGILSVVVTAQPDGAPPSAPMRLEQIDDKLYVLAGLEAGRTPAETAAAYRPPDHLADFGFGEPFATGFGKVMYAEARALR